MQRRDPTDCRGIDPKVIAIFPILLAIGFAICLLTAAVFGIIQSNSHVTEYNAAAEYYNSLPESTRKTLKPIIASGRLTDELKVVPKKSRQIPDLKDNLEKLKRASIVSAWIIGNLVTALCYFLNCQYYFYLADLPWKTPIGWVLMIELFPTGWIFLLASFIRMKREDRINRRAETEAVKAAAAAFLRQDNYVAPAKVRKAFLARYTQLRTTRYAEKHKLRLAKLRKEIEHCEIDVRECGKRLVRLNRDLGKMRAEYAELQEPNSLKPPTRADCEQEVKQLLEMRGVAKVTASHGGAHREPWVCFFIQVRVQYHQELYDFGDYEVTFYPDDFKSRQVRSGMRKDKRTTDLFYDDPNYGFCYGSRKSEIKSFAAESRIVEAMTLIIDCMHSVNPEHEKMIPKCYRKIDTIELVKNQMKKGGRKKCNK